MAKAEDVVQASIDDMLAGASDEFRLAYFNARPKFANGAETFELAAWARFGNNIYGDGGQLIDEFVQFATSCRSAASFGGDTLVVMSDGTRVRIADVGVGDQVTAWDRHSGLVVVSLVTATLPHQDTLIEAQMSDGSGLVGDRGSPVLVTHRHGMVETQNLDPTNVLLSPDGAQLSVVALDWSASTDGACSKPALNYSPTFGLTPPPFP